jgi:hypothetical protein
MEQTDPRDTLELRTEFVNQWMWLDGPDPVGKTMAEILDVFDTELGAFARNDPSFDAADEMDQAIEWLAERGYVVRHGVTGR